MKKRKRNIKNKVNSLSSRALLALHITLPIIILAFIAVAVKLEKTALSNPDEAVFIAPYLLEYIFASLAITFGGALLIDISEKYDSRR